MKNLNKGFTLIELAITIVIVGLLTVAVVSGQSIIRSSKINSTVNNVEKMGTAIRAFQLEFDATPGMMVNAYDYFGDECGDNTDNTYYGCNGENNNPSPRDRCLDGRNTDCEVDIRFGGDIRRLFVHLNLSRIYPDLVYITDTRTDPDCLIGNTYHPTVLEENGITWVSSESPKRIYLQLFRKVGGWFGTSCITHPFGNFTYPSIANQIDKKLDDGNGRRGKVKAQTNPSNENFDSSNCIDTVGNYNLSNDEKSCGVRVRLQ
jgi:prepilin-type N-terminal cleavage/methylation domain-containing protein